MARFSKYRAMGQLGMAVQQKSREYTPARIRLDRPSLVAIDRNRYLCDR